MTAVYSLPRAQFVLRCVASWRASKRAPCALGINNTSKSDRRPFDPARPTEGACADFKMGLMISARVLSTHWNNLAVQQNRSLNGKVILRTSLTVLVQRCTWVHGMTIFIYTSYIHNYRRGGSIVLVVEVAHAACSNEWCLNCISTVYKYRSHRGQRTAIVHTYQIGKKSMGPYAECKFAVYLARVYFEACEGSLEIPENANPHILCIRPPFQLLLYSTLQQFTVHQST